MSKPFTPGNWEAITTTTSAMVRCGNIGSKGICADFTNSGATPAEGNWNAILAAASPDMYEAGELALKAIDGILEFHKDLSDYEKLRAAFDALEVALNKADGAP